ncbi:MAG: family 20 glycosylhydrolase [Planctomycetota bacterium]
MAKIHERTGWLFRFGPMLAQAHFISAAAILLASIHACEASDPVSLVPLPHRIALEDSRLALDSAATVSFEDASLEPIAEILSQGLFTQSGVKLSTGQSTNAESGILLRLDASFADEAYRIAIHDSVVVTGRDYRAIAWAAATLIQMVSAEGERLTFQKGQIQDAPDIEFRSVLLDIARRWHPPQTLKDTINLLWLNKIKYLHLHLSDNQSFTFPSRQLPKLPSKGRSYTEEELSDIVRFADQRGVIVIPEIDVPGHASWVARMPATFGTTDPETGQSRSVGIVNMANERSYEALDRLFGELAETFASSPYIHLGCDEVGAGGLIQLPEYQPYCKKHGLKEAEQGGAHELYLHFIERADELVRKHGKQSIIWNDFGGRSTPNAAIPKDVLVMAWAGQPNRSAEEGYTIVTAPPYPLYMVPPQHNAPEDHQIYDWDYNVYQRRGQAKITLPEASVIGSELCFWEQRYNEVVPILMPRIPAFAERLWNVESKGSFSAFKQRRRHTLRVARNLVLPVHLVPQGLTDARSIDFAGRLSVQLTSSVPGRIVCAVNKDWEDHLNAEYLTYNQPISLNETMTVSAKLIGADGEQVGGVTQQRFRKIAPAHKYRLLGPTPITGWEKMPEFRQLESLRTGVTGFMTTDRANQINRSMFAGLQPRGHVDVRLHDLYNPLTLELNGQIDLPVDGVYQFQIRANNGMAHFCLGDKLVGETKVAGRNYRTQGRLRSGSYPVKIKYFNRRTWNDLNILVKLPGDTEFKPYESLVVPISEWKHPSMLRSIPEETEFVDPAVAANKNLATGKPVAVSGGTQLPNAPANAVDGVTGNESGWHTDPFPQWLRVDLEKPHRVNRIKLHTYYDGRRYYQYSVEVSLDGRSWQRVVDMSKNTDTSTRDGDEHNFDPVEARYVRVNMLANSANSGVHLNEVMVYDIE